MADDDSDWSETEDVEDEKRLKFKRTLIRYALIGGALSILAPLAGLLYVRMNSTITVPVPQDSQIFKRPVPLSPYEKAMMPASPATVLAQQKGEGSLSYAHGDLGYDSAPPQPAPAANPPPPPPPKPAPKVAAVKPLPATGVKPFSPPQLEPGFSGQATTTANLRQGLSAPSGLSNLSNILPNVGSMLKNIPSSIGSSLGGLGLGSLTGGSSSNGALPTASQPVPVSGSTPQLDNSGP